MKLYHVLFVLLLAIILVQSNQSDKENKDHKNHEVKAAKEKQHGNHAEKQKHQSHKEVKQHHEGKATKHQQHSKQTGKSLHHEVKSLHKTKQHHNSKHRAKSSRMHPLLKQQVESGQCSWTCSGIIDGHNNSTWTLTFILQGNMSITLSYNSTGNFFSTFNEITEIVVIFSGTISYVGIYNTTSSSMIVINYKTYQANLLVNINVAFEETTDYVTAFALVYQIIFDYSNGQIDTGITDSGQFNFTGYLGSLQGNASTDPLPIYKDVYANFTQYVTQLQTNVVLDFVGVFEYAFGGVSYVSYGISIIFQAIIETTGGYSTKFMQSLFIYIMKNIANLSSGFETFVTLIVNGYLSFFGGLEQAFYAIQSGHFSSNYSSQTVQIGGQNYTTITVTQGNSWDIDVKATNYELILIYEDKMNMFAIVNKDTNITMAFNGDVGVFIIINMNNGIGFIVNEGTGNAKVLKNYADAIVGVLQQQGVLNYLKSIQNIIQQEKNNLAIASIDVFNFWRLLRAEINNDASTASSDIGSLFSDSFSPLMNLMSKVVLGEASMLYNLVQSVVGTPTGIGMNVANLMEQIYTSLTGQFDFTLMEKVKLNLAFNIATGFKHVADFILGGITNAVNTAEHFTSNIIDFIPRVNSIIGRAFTLHKGRSRNYVRTNSKKHLL